MIGQNIAHYRVTAKLGAGGMGEVYRATDAKLGRDVALKILPPAVADDPERMARFQREAQVLAALNHPNIAAIYGLEESGGVRALAMELVEGQTLAERLQHGPLPVEEALPIARQMAEGLEYAHEKGIIHRDLKPANVKVTPDGAVKILDFGLAKALEDSPAAQDISTSPTLTMAATKAGIILGTAAYMSPEQARGKRADKRADVWGLGVVLFELLTGRQLFAGETGSDSMASILTRDPEWSALPPATPRSVRKLLERCLTREVKYRLRDIGEARIALESAIAHPDEPAPEIPVAQAASLQRRALPWVAGVAAGVVLGALGWQAISGPSAAPAAPVRFTITLPQSDRMTVMEDTNTGVAVSPDGARLIYSARRDGIGQLFLRSFDQLESKAIPGTENAKNPFFSPDGRWVAFVAGNRMKKVSLEGGSPLDLVGADWGGGTWGSDDTIVYTPSYALGLWRVAASGGAPQKLTEPNREKGELGHWWPQWLPGGEKVLFTAWSTPVAKAHVMVLDLKTGKTQTILEGGTYARYSPTGHLLFVRDEGLMAVPFSLRTLQVSGAPVRVLEDVFVDQQDGLSYMAFSQTGTFLYAPKSTLHLSNQVVWVDRQGKEEVLPLPQHRYKHPRLSPDERKIAITTEDFDSQDIWVYDMVRGSLNRVVAGPTSEFNPLWTLDGKEIVHQLERPQFDIFISPADGTGKGRPLVTSAYDKNHFSFSPDGKELLYVERSPETAGDIWVQPMDGSKPRPYLVTPASEEGPRFSPDGRWVVYKSDVSGRNEVYVQGYPDPGERVQVSTEGGESPMWARNGKEIYYRKGDQLMAVQVAAGAAFAVGKPQMLFRGDYDESYPGTNYDLTAGGRFLMVKTSPESAPRTIVVVLNWFDELRRLAPLRK